jgi:D-beta-D-heptose 7-phosphate kinase / D-beta-D-heptose 1-phosphate adenosyltransferase
MEDIFRKFLRLNREHRVEIYCAGDAMVDEYYPVKVKRISPEFPMPIMTSTGKPVFRPGGAANVACQLKNFNVLKDLICFEDENAQKVFANHGISPFSYRRAFRFLPSSLPRKQRFMDGKVQVNRHDIESAFCGLTKEERWEFQEGVKTVFRHRTSPNVIIISDYDKGFFDDNFNLYEWPRTKTIVDPKKGPLEKWKYCTIFKPNAAEAESLSGKTNWKDQARFFRQELSCEAVVITFAGDRVAGMIWDEFFEFVPEEKVEVNSVVGAGDCFAAIFGLAIAHNFSVQDAVKIAYKAGSIYVQKQMNTPICPAELIDDKIVEAKDLQNRNFKLVLTNGCFDLLHKGHLNTLKFAKSKGEKLAVAINSDESVRKLKGDSRPVMPLEHRAAVLASLNFVDFVIPYSELDPLQVILDSKPDVLVKGGDYSLDQIIGRDCVEETLLAPILEGVSTTSFLSNYSNQRSLAII